MKWNKQKKSEEELSVQTYVEELEQSEEKASEQLEGEASEQFEEETSEQLEEGELSLSEREELEQLRKERDERNLKEKAYDKLYDNLNLSVRSLDIFIGAMVVLFIFIVLKGMGLF